MFMSAATTSTDTVYFKVLRSMQSFAIDAESKRCVGSVGVACDSTGAIAKQHLVDLKEASCMHTLSGQQKPCQPGQQKLNALLVSRGLLIAC